MDRSKSVRRVLVEGPNSLGERSRQLRWRAFSALFPQVAEMRVIDLGGTGDSWLRAPIRPAQVVVLNLAPHGDAGADWVTVQQGDACAPPPELLAERFDLVFSNSLIEHVGGHLPRRQLAKTVHALAERHWVQTPYRYFPLEPHWLFPGMQFLPTRLKASIARRWPLAHSRAGSTESAVRAALAVDLLSRTEMAHYFPHSSILAEHVGPLTKSLVAVRGSSTLDRPGNSGPRSLRAVIRASEGFGVRL